MKQSGPHEIPEGHRDTHRSVDHTLSTSTVSLKHNTSYISLCTDSCFKTFMGRKPINDVLKAH